MNKQTFKEFNEEKALIANMKAAGVDVNTLTEDVNASAITIDELQALNEEIDRLQALGTPEAMQQLEALCD